MKRFLMVILFTIATAPAFAADVGISISLGQPGFYGQIDIGDFPPPRLIYAEPVIVEQVVVAAPVIYLRVQPDHVAHWDRYCHEYRACDQRVYFVEDSWYDEVYVPAYSRKHGNQGKNGKSKHKDKGHGNQHRQD
jgi:hypothetical protein